MTTTNSLVLLTGSTGHVGAAVTRELLAKGYRVRVLVRETSKTEAIDGLDVERVIGDVNNAQSVRNALNGADYCIHCAAVVDIGRHNDNLMQKVNILGTQNVVDACAEMGIKRLVHMSTSHVIELAPSNVGKTVQTESDTFSLPLAHDWYARSKTIATNYVLAKAKAGELDAVIVYPSGVMGPYGWRVSNTNQVLIEYMQGRLPARIIGSYSFVDVRDVAFGTVAALQKGRAGEGYLLTGETITVNELFAILEEKTGVKAPHFVAPMWAARLWAPVSEWFAHSRGKKPLFSATALDTLKTNSFFSHKKAKTELGFNPMPIKQSISDAVDFILENNQGKINSKKLLNK